MEVIRMSFSAMKLGALLPEAVITFFALLVLLIDTFAPGNGEGKDHLGYIALLGVIFGFLSLIPQVGRSQVAFSGMYITDGFSIFFKVIVLFVAFLTILSYFFSII